MIVEHYTVYDLETLSNCFTAVFQDVETGKEKDFVIHESRNDLVPLMKFLDALYRHSYWLVGFNCNAFDAQILEFLLKHYKRFKTCSAEQIASEIYDKAQFIISLDDKEKFGNLIPEWNFLIPHIDIYKQKHYDGSGKRCSLKWLEFTMRFENIESMPIHHSSFITKDDVADILRYNYNDVRATARLFEINRFETDLRFKLSEKYDLNLINASEPRMAREIFGKYLSEAMGISYRDLKEKRTIRSWVCTGPLIFPYVQFRDPILRGAKQFYEKLEFNPAESSTNNFGLEKVEKVFKFHNIKEVVIGLGGIHGCISPGVYTSNSEWTIRDIDGTSYYPNLGIKNEVYPEHLSNIFCSTYDDVFKLRQTIDKKDPVNYALKIVLNSTYGLSKEPNNYLYDPNYTYAITVNGQLLLLMLGELLRLKVKTIVFYQFNTDGVSIGYHPSEEAIVNECMKRWEKLTQINLEDKYYSKMVIVDVNNYIAVDDKGKVKRKGLFGYSMKPEDVEMFYHKNPSALIVPKALEAYFVHGVPVKDYIYNSTDIYDFCLGAKIKKDFDLIQYSYNHKARKLDGDIINQAVARYYVSKNPTTLIKKYNDKSKTPGRLVALQKKQTMTLFNIYEKKEMKDYNLNYNFYIRRANDVINTVLPNITNLKFDF